VLEKTCPEKKKLLFNEDYFIRKFIIANMYEDYVQRLFTKIIKMPSLVRALSLA